MLSDQNLQKLKIKVLLNNLLICYFFLIFDTFTFETLKQSHIQIQFFIFYVLEQSAVDISKVIPAKKKDNNVDEKEVWALRAQALKSLACKRASKVKMAKKVNNFVSLFRRNVISNRLCDSFICKTTFKLYVQEKKAPLSTKQTIIAPAKDFEDLSPVPSPKPVVTSLTKLSYSPINVNELLLRYKVGICKVFDFS